MRKAWFIVFFLVFSVSLAFPTNGFSFYGDDFRPGSEPEGFRGIKWGTNISTLKDMQFIDYYIPEHYSGNIIEYKRKGDNLTIASARIDKISYLFWKGKFYSVGIISEGVKNWEKLRETCFNILGKRNISSFSGGIESYRWEGDISSVYLSYSPKRENRDFPGTFHSDLIQLWLYSEVIGKEVGLFTNQKLREKTGF